MTDYDLSQVKTLIVDDHDPMRRIFLMMLKALGMREVEHANDGQEALEILKHFDADIIITDLEMPVINGFELTRLVRNGEAGSDPFTPIIMVSGHAEKESIFAARDAGINEFLAKPVSAKDLYARIRRIIEHPRPFIRADEYFGPDRRRRAQKFAGPDRRKMEYTYSA